MNAPRDSTRYLDKYLNELIDYGGDLMTRADVIRDMQAQGTDQLCIDRWLQGCEYGQRLRAKRDSLEFNDPRNPTPTPHEPLKLVETKLGSVYALSENAVACPYRRCSKFKIALNTSGYVPTVSPR